MALLPTGFSWPGWTWWLSLKATEQGAWASALGAIAAVCVALFIAYLPRLDANKSRASRRRLIASLIYGELQKAQGECTHAWVTLKARIQDHEIRHGFALMDTYRMEALYGCDRYALEMSCFDGKDYEAIVRAVSEYPALAGRVRACAKRAELIKPGQVDEFELLQANMLLGDLGRVSGYLDAAVNVVRRLSVLDHEGEAASFERALTELVNARIRDAQEADVVADAAK